MSRQKQLRGEKISQKTQPDFQKAESSSMQMLIMKILRLNHWQPRQKCQPSYQPTKRDQKTFYLQ